MFHLIHPLVQGHVLLHAVPRQRPVQALATPSSKIIISFTLWSLRPYAPPRGPSAASSTGWPPLSSRIIITFSLWSKAMCSSTRSLGSVQYRPWPPCPPHNNPHTPSVPMARLRSARPCLSACPTVAPPLQQEPRLQQLRHDASDVQTKQGVWLQPCGMEIKEQQSGAGCGVVRCSQGAPRTQRT